MSEPDTFIARWSRLKSESGLEEGGTDEKRAAETPSLPAFDPASLPPIESIGPDSDIRLFLQAGVPEELVRAALRTTWTADRSIRDFIGIAESQWDFNEPTAIPGFGPLGAGDCARVAQVLASLHDGIEEVSDSPGVVTQPASTRPAVVARGASTRPEPECFEAVDAAQFAPAPAENSQDTDPEPQVAEMRARRSHGGALPR